MHPDQEQEQNVFTYHVITSISTRCLQQRLAEQESPSIEDIYVGMKPTTDTNIPVAQREFSAHIHAHTGTPAAMHCHTNSYVCCQIKHDALPSTFIPRHELVLLCGCGWQSFEEHPIQRTGHTAVVSIAGYAGSLVTY